MFDDPNNMEEVCVVQDVFFGLKYRFAGQEKLFFFFLNLIDSA